ncbi:MAG: Bifunctional NMN adenylyltransferase/Nudix hydrolase [Paracidovorax wautersii]|uniref:Bifunctional NMN adenylyltransferase/Nudix hydrolase n=1 Tax=Paracidovorax wautersii TaxID=1177982 RepID=A0A7V8FQ84_9BURK|nr:MAG: Bifunctional NMN adenylyltransferase/Nudix hydrolase [Paracidovorax wautersii]
MAQETTRQSQPAADAAVYIGRFQVFHRGHLGMLREALARARLCVVVIGSAYQARTPKNPFFWHERAEMIRRNLSEADRARVLFVPVRDYYDLGRWEAAVRASVEQALAGQGLAGVPPLLIGHFKDVSSQYLHGFEGWPLVSLERITAAGRPLHDASQLRDALFALGREASGEVWAALGEQVPPGTLDFLRGAVAQPWFAEMAEEWRMLRAYWASWSAAPYPPTLITTDALVLCAGHVLLVQRGELPGRGLYALPGGFLNPNETLAQGARRELLEETGLALPDDLAPEQSAVFDHPDRSLRGRTVTHGFLWRLAGDTAGALPPVQGQDGAAHAVWLPVADLQGLEDRFFDDHFHMLLHMLDLPYPVY